MNLALPVVMLLLGVALAALAAWIILRLIIDRAREQIRAEFGDELLSAQGELSTANERLRASAAEIEQRDKLHKELKDDNAALQKMYHEESNARVRAEQKNEQISKLETTLKEKNTEIQGLQSEATSLREQRSTLETNLKQERTNLVEQRAVLDEAQKKLSEAFKVLASEALKLNNTSFLELAKTQFEGFQKEAKGDLEKRQESIQALVKPVKESLEKVDTKIQELEKVRVGAYETLKQQVDQLITGNKELRSETSRLVGALGTSSVRGRWGEMHLKRVVEMAGMVEYCDFDTQVSVSTEEGRLRPDVVVRLPGGKNIVVDAKAPLSAYLEALDEDDDALFQQKMRQHAQQVRDHMTALCEKRYWSQFEPTPEFVFLFLPGEVFFSAALRHDPMLIEYGAEKRVIVATPTTLIALLRAVAYGWQQEAVAKNAQEISNLGKDLYERIATMAGHLKDLGRSLDNSVDYFNKSIASLELRVLVSARRFRDLKVPTSGGEIVEIKDITKSPRSLTATELVVDVPTK
jgi:DNA recombination protein RmuC